MNNVAVRFDFIVNAHGNSCEGFCFSLLGLNGPSIFNRDLFETRRR